MSIFTPCELGVLRVPNGCADTGYVTISIDTYDLQIPITGFTLDMGTNHQFLHTLDEFIYLYAFGDRIGELTITGVAFVGPVCDGLADALGPSRLLEYYKENKVSRPGGPQKTIIQINPVNAAFPQLLIGFLTGVRMEMPNPALPIVQWALRYNVVLDKAGDTGAAGS